MELKRIGALSVARLAAVLYGLLGALIGAVCSVLAFVAGNAFPSEAGFPFSALFGVAAVFIFPFLYAGIAFVACLIGASLYNLLAGLMGGVHLEFQPIAQPIAPPAAAPPPPGTGVA